MRVRSLLGGIVLLGAAATANATAIRWIDVQAPAQAANVPDLNWLQYSPAQIAPAINAYDFKLGGFLNDLLLKQVSLIVIPPGKGPSVTPPVSVPEPATLGLLGLGLFGVGFARRRKE